MNPLNVVDMAPPPETMPRAGARSTLRILWQAQFISIRNAGRYDTRMRVAFIFILFFDIAVGAWSASQLITHITQWQAMGATAVDTGLWSICLLTWSGMVGVVMLEALQQGLSDDTSLLLFTLPIAPAARFRALYSMFFLRRLWNWLLLETCIAGVALVITLGWQQALSWLVLLQLGVACVVYATVVALMLFIRYMLSSGRTKTRIVAITMIGLIAAFAIWLIWHPQGEHKASSLLWYAAACQGTSSMVGAMPCARPTDVIFSAILFALLLLIGLGPLANVTGKLYTAAFLTIQGWDRSRKTIAIPGVRQLSRLFARYRNLTGALFVKEILNQSRNLLFWGRMVVLVLALVFFPLVHNAVAAYKLSDTFFVVGYASGLTLLTILEQAPNVMSGEGNRLSLYLTAPFDLAALLRAKLIVFLLPILIEGLGIDLLLSWRLGLTIGTIGFSAVAVALVIIGSTALPVWGGVWDENLNLAVEGSIQMMMQEEAAITPRRLVLLNVSLLLFAALLLIVWKLPPMLAITALFVLNIVVLTTMLRVSQTYLRRLLSVT